MLDVTHQTIAFRRASVVQFLADQWHRSAASADSAIASSTIYQQGQVRHLPFPLLWKSCWGSCPSPGTYQNGAFWATPLNWILAALDDHVMRRALCTTTHVVLHVMRSSSSNILLQGFHSEAAAVAAAAASSFITSGVMECINTDKRYTGVADYVASATNLLGAVHPASSSQ